MQVILECIVQGGKMGLNGLYFPVVTTVYSGSKIEQTVGLEKYAKS